MAQGHRRALCLPTRICVDAVRGAAHVHAARIAALAARS
ncbi:hypothetical protein P355_5373 [Burkholderia cenocepacia KC-01]|nr:hypothetical protein P355_5373 [Burkholderia cenocepacia KC-01]